MTRVLIALAVLTFANTSLVHAALSRRPKAQAAKMKSATAQSKPLVLDGFSLGAVPSTAAGRRALLIQIQRMGSTGLGVLAQHHYRSSSDFGPVLVLAELEVLAEVWKRPVSWVQQNFTALYTNRVDRDGKPLEMGKPTVHVDDDEAAEPTSEGINLHEWAPTQGALIQ